MKVDSNSEIDQDDHAASRLAAFWRISSDTARMLFLRSIAYPFYATTPVEFAKNSLTNLHEDELQDVLDWMSENHWLPPGM